MLEKTEDPPRIIGPAPLTTCACCGVEWRADRSNPRVDHMDIAVKDEQGHPILRAFHKRCYEFVLAEVDRAVGLSKLPKKSG